MPVLLLDTLEQVRCGEGEKDCTHFDKWCSFVGVVVSLVVLVGGRGFSLGGGRGWYVGGRTIVVLVEETDAVFYEAGAIFSQFPSSFYFSVYRVIIV